jgi:hypothetical protein
LIFNSKKKNMPITDIREYAELPVFEFGLDKTGNSYPRGDLTQVAIAPVLYGAQRPAKIELTIGILATGDEVVNITSPVEITLYRRVPIAVGAGLGTTDVIDGIIVPTVNIVIPAATLTAVAICPYVGTPITGTSIAAIYEGLRPCLSVEEATFPQSSADTAMTQNKSQGPWKTSDVFTRSWTSNLNGALFRDDPAIPLLEAKGQGIGKVYIMITQAPFESFPDGEGGFLRYGAGPGATEGLVTIGNTSPTDPRAENQKVSYALTGDGRAVPYRILTPDI